MHYLGSSNFQIGKVIRFPPLDLDSLVPSSFMYVFLYSQYLYSLHSPREIVVLELFIKSFRQTREFETHSSSLIPP
jgi:hypothetical protein